MRKLDLTGQRFGRLTVLGPAENIGDKTAWVCRCDCGQETIVMTFHLRNGNTTSCGCLRGLWDPTFIAEQTQRKRLELTGQRFGRLTVLRPAENIDGKTAWLCRCDCGAETVVKTEGLRSGHTKTCGCRDGSSLEMFLARKNMVQKNNTSGVSGVEWLPKRRRWKASICHQGKRFFLGAFPHFQDAVEARRQAEKTVYDAFSRELAGGGKTQTASDRPHILAKEDR